MGVRKGENDSLAVAADYKNYLPQGRLSKPVANCQLVIEENAVGVDSVVLSAEKSVVFNFEQPTLRLNVIHSELELTRGTPTVVDCDKTAIAQGAKICYSIACPTTPQEEVFVLGQK